MTPDARNGPEHAPRPVVGLPVPRRALAVGAHPDDVEFGAGATLARWAEAGCEVSLVICTDGSKGTWDPHADLAELVATREAEARAAAEALGATGEVVFLRRVDGELENDRSTRAELAGHIRRLRPDVLLGHDPWKRYRLHPDHRAAGFLTCDALVAARDPHFFPEQLGNGTSDQLRNGSLDQLEEDARDPLEDNVHEPLGDDVHDQFGHGPGVGLTHHRPGALLLFEADEPDHAEPVEPRHVDAKIAALEAHRSQYESTMFITESGSDAGTASGAGADDPGGSAATVERARFHAEIHDGVATAGAWAGVPAAERFRLMPTDR